MLLKLIIFSGFAGITVFIVGALLGHTFLKESTTLTAHLMTFASGGILYLLIQDIIPASKLKKKLSDIIGCHCWFFGRNNWE